jgi:hypothetical protein
VPGVVKSFEKTHFIAPTAPTDGRVQVGSLWSDTTNNILKRCTSVSPKTFVSVESGGGGFYQTIQSGGTPLTQRSKFNFTGAGVSVTDDSANDRTTIDIPGGGAGSDTKVAVYKDGTQVGTVARKLDFRGSELTVTEDSGNDQFDVEVIAVRTFSRSDTYTTTTTGTAVDASTYPVKSFSIQVKGTGAVPTSFTVVLEGSLDGTNFDTITTFDSATLADGKIKFTGAADYPVRYFRSRVSALALGSATNIVVTLLGTQ